MSCIPCTSRGNNPAKKAKLIKGKPAWVGDVAMQVRTGDILLFSSKHSSSNITKYFTKSRWDHIGIVIKPSPTRAYIVEWGGGLFACELVERLNEYAEWDAMELVLRQLRLQAEEEANRRIVEERMEQFVDELFRAKMGQNRGVPMGQVISAARDQLFSKSTSVSAKEVHVDDLEQLFCSKTVAVVYKAAGILAPNRIANKFLPKHFSMEHDQFLDLQGGAALGPEQRITFESKRMRDAVSNMLKLPILEVLAGSTAKEDRSALLIEKFVRRVAARRELRRRKAGRGSVVTEKAPLYKGARRKSTKERTDLLRQVAAEGHKKPEDTLQVTWIDEDAPFEGDELPPPPLI